MTMLPLVGIGRQVLEVLQHVEGAFFFAFDRNGMVNLLPCGAGRVEGPDGFAVCPFRSDSLKVRSPRILSWAFGLGVLVIVSVVVTGEAERLGGTIAWFPFCAAFRA